MLCLPMTSIDDDDDNDDDGCCGDDPSLRLTIEQRRLLRKTGAMYTMQKVVRASTASLTSECSRMMLI